MSKGIGAKIKHLRTQKKMTLKDLSEQSNLSVGFLSQLERGMTSIATDTLENIADIFDVDISYFFIKKKSGKSPIVRRYEKEFCEIFTLGCIQYNLSNNIKESNIFPRLIEILPSNTEEHVHSYEHSGEEFIYVLEGILTVFLNNTQYDIYPGDSIHYNSSDHHNWANYTNKMVKLLVIAVPNPFNEINVDV